MCCMNINPVQAFSDNYIWVIDNGTDGIIVDPGEAQDVLAYIEEKHLNLEAIILTHKHDDHIGGVSEVLAKYPDTPVYGPKETEHLNTHLVKDGDEFELLGQTLKVFKSGGHTEGHISYLMVDNLFCGDALFSGGCGRVFTGDYQAQYDALQTFKALPDNVKVYAAHEYTETNLRFAHSIDPTDQAFTEALKEVEALRASDKPTLPSTIEKEKDINLFLQAESLDTFIELRNQRDNF